MTNINKQILTDDAGHPVAVQIAYADWVVLEARLADLEPVPQESADLKRHFGVIPLRVDPMAYQQQARDEWR